jgi:1-acyl-sn-glycerol-3-phosphate acyltransferase
MISIFLRSLVFNIGFYLSLLIHMLIAIPTFLLPRQAILEVAKSWSRSMIWMLRVICNIDVEYRGLEKVPSGPLLVASKHQSAWETIALLALFKQPLFILKRELTWLPLFGLYLLKAQMIPINRSSGVRAMSKMTPLARERVRDNRQLIIFPEGTRRPVGAEPRYKFGVAQIYVDCGVQCVPVALNAGLFWPRRTFLRYPGTVIVEFLDIVPPGLSRDDFLARISEAIETSTAKLVEEGRQEQARLLGDLAPRPEPARGK